MSEEAEWAKMSDEEDAELAVLVEKAKHVLTEEEFTAALNESLFPVDSEHGPYGSYVFVNDKLGNFSMNASVLRATLKRRLAAKEEG